MTVPTRNPSRDEWSPPPPAFGVLPVRGMALVAAACAALATAPGPAAAAPHDAYAGKSLHLRAGPGRDYPVVAVLARGTRLDVQGCLPDYSWCDVVSGPLRGWVYAANIESMHEGRPVPLMDYGSALGIAIFSFILGDYWGEHYHDRPWYRDRDTWGQRPHRSVPPAPAHPPGLMPPPAHGVPPPPHGVPPPHEGPTRGRTSPTPPRSGLPAWMHPPQLPPQVRPKPEPKPQPKPEPQPQPQPQPQPPGDQPPPRKPPAPGQPARPEPPGKP